MGGFKGKYDRMSHFFKKEFRSVDYGGLPCAIIERNAVRRF
ncbi:hypothetical protein HMPREF9402_2196 [Turicibacter sp. HGF1]|nr:hypothetical protein HMPREF9402_2196 [Turicibacter sp. HGF1]